MTATILPFVTPAEMALPARRGYSVVSDEMHARLRAAEARAESEPSMDAEAELDAAWRAIEAHEAEGRDADAEAEFERLHGEGR